MFFYHPWLRVVLLLPFSPRLICNVGLHWLFDLAIVNCKIVIADFDTEQPNKLVCLEDYQ